MGDPLFMGTSTVGSVTNSRICRRHLEFRVLRYGVWELGLTSPMPRKTRLCAHYCASGGSKTANKDQKT